MRKIPMKYQFLLLLFCLGLMLQNSDVAAAVRSPAETRKFQQFELTMPGLTQEMFYPEFWIDRLEAPDALVMDEQEISTYNQLNYAQSAALVDLANYPEQVDADFVRQEIASASPLPQNNRFRKDGQALDDSDFAHYREQMNWNQIPESVPVRWGIVVQRGELRTFPDSEPAFNKTGDAEVDMLLETGVNTGDVLAILHESADHEWYFVQRYNYRGWVAKANVAVGTRSAVMQYHTTEPRLVVTGARVRTAVDPGRPEVSARALDMGDSLPLLKNRPNSIGSMSIHSNFAVELPVRNADGTLALEPALISRSADVNVGYLPFSRSNLLRQAFKLQGERYGWGDCNNCRDCTGFVISVYRSFGIVLPRNSGEQAAQAVGQTFHLRKNSERKSNPEVVKQMCPGDVFTSNTHVMLYLGEVDGEYYVIHDVIAADYTPVGQPGIITDPLRQIAVTPLLALEDANGRNFLDYFAIARRFILPETLTAEEIKQP